VVIQRRRGGGQVLVIFGLALVTIVIIAALAFDTGMMLLEKRDQQNAADAAALAGARYLVTGAARDPKAAARDIATENGFTQGADSETVIVNVPPTSGQFRNAPGFIEVIIRSTRPSIFGGILGAAGWNIGARAVAANQQGLDLPFAMLALHPTACDAIKVTGSGLVTVAGTVQVNSECKPAAMRVAGTGTLEVTAEGATCNAVGGIVESKGPGSELDCVQQPDSYAFPDPLRGLPEPAVPPLPAAIQQVTTTSKKVPDGCPGAQSPGAPATAAAPKTCAFGGSYAGTAWRLFPGYYPGGLDFGKGTFYLEPGIYYVGGGGFVAGGGGGTTIDSIVYAVAPGGTTSGAGGILIFNTEDAMFHSACSAGTGTAAQCIGKIQLNGGSADVNLQPLSDGSAWDGIIIFEDRDLSVTGDDVIINGGNSTLEVAGTIYVPKGDVRVNGSTGTLILDQVIASTYVINGNTGTIDVRYRSGVTAKIRGVGLVE
jgi:putative Flp pilus-assembly TadE/G-like protein